MISTIVIIALSFMSLGMHLVKHGENRCNEKYNFFYYLFATIVVYFPYYHAGLFDKFF